MKQAPRSTVIFSTLFLDFYFDFLMAHEECQKEKNLPMKALKRNETDKVYIYFCLFLLFC